MYYSDLDTPLFQVRSSCVFGLLGHSHQQVAYMHILTLCIKIDCFILNRKDDH